MKEVLVTMRKNNLTSDDEAKKHFQGIIIAEKSKTDEPTSNDLSYDDRILFNQIYGEYKRIKSTKSQAEDIMQEENKQPPYVFIDLDSELQLKIKISHRKKHTDPKYLINNIKIEDRQTLFDAYNEHTLKYSICISLLKENFEHNYMTTMSQLCRFSCHDAYRVTQRLYGKFMYQNIDF